MPAMPKPLLHRRSLLDLVSSHKAADDSSHRPHEEQSNSANAAALLPPPPTSPRPTSEYAMPASRHSSTALSADRPVSPPVQPENARTKRMSLLKFRNFSESHLSARAKEHAAREEVPPMPALNRGEFVD